MYLESFLNFVSTKNFPKEYKYSLGRDMERDVLVLMRWISLLEKPFLVVLNKNIVLYQIIKDSLELSIIVPLRKDILALQDLH